MTTDGEQPAAFFDLDRTVIARSSTFVFSRPLYLNGLISRTAVLRAGYAHFLFHLGRADHAQIERMRRYLSQLVTGWQAQQVSEIVAEALDELIQPLVYREATALIDEHHAAGRDVVLVSSSGMEVVQPIGALLGVDHVIATRMKIVDGRFTGVLDFYAYAENKAVAIREIAEQRGYDLARSYAYSDSFTDLPMLEVVGHPTAVNPDRPLRRVAVARDWPILDFTDPVRLRDRVAALRPPAPKQLLAAAIGAGAGAAGIMWYVNRRSIRLAEG